MIFTNKRKELHIRRAHSMYVLLIISIYRISIVYTKVNIINLTLMLSFLSCVAYSEIRLSDFPLSSGCFFGSKKTFTQLELGQAGYTSLEEICEHITYFKILEIYHITSGKNQQGQWYCGLVHKCLLFFWFRYARSRFGYIIRSVTLN